MPVSGSSLAITGTGIILIWSGWNRTTLSATAGSLLKGKLPPAGNATVIQAVTGSGTSPQPGVSLPAGKISGNNQQIAQNVIAANPSYSGWGSGTNWTDLVNLWNQESGWNNLADNPSSGAYGIPQALPATKMPLAAQPPSDGGTSDPTAQIEWGLDYILGRYGSPEMAWAHEQANNWY